MEPCNGSLVLYKQKAAIVRDVNKKLFLELDDGRNVSVRPKDVQMLHPGPTAAFPLPIPPTGDPETARELLEGQETTIAELAELIYDLYTPATAWETWQLVRNGRLFSGSPAAISINDSASVTEFDTRLEMRKAEDLSWKNFETHIETGQFTADDKKYLQEIESLALGHAKSSRTMTNLGQKQTPEAAHSWLLAAGRWDETVNPYPERANLELGLVKAKVGDLPDEDRVDLTYLTALAIDDEGNQDPDDALSLENGRLWVHVADVAAIVCPNSEVDSAARGRSANLYLPEGTVSMLPAELTERLGLGLQEISPALSIGIDLDDEGQILNINIAPSWVRVTRLSYAEAETRLNEPILARLSNLANQRRQIRIDNGAIELTFPETKVIINEVGGIEIRPLPPYQSREIVREAMLLAGEATARFALLHDIPLAYTSQPPPRAEYLKLDSPAGMFAARKTMQRGRRLVKPEKHAGLGLDAYVQVTSPLRRYLDLLAHQQLRAFLAGNKLLNPDEVTLHTAETDAFAGSVRRAERQSIVHWKLAYLLRHPEWDGEGIIVDEQHGRHTVLIPELAIDGPVRLRQARPLNETIKLAVANIDLARLAINFQVKD